MNIDIRVRNMDGNAELSNYIEHRLSFAFARNHHEIEYGTITLSDVNGCKGGIDKQCQIVLTPSGLRPIVITERRESLRQAIDRCLYRAGHCLHRKLKRRHVRLKRPRPKTGIQTLSGS